MVEISAITRKIFSTKNITATAFIGVGVYQTCKDVKKAPKEKRAQILMKDAAILTGSGVGFFGASHLISKVPNQSLISHVKNKNAKRTIFHTENVIKDCFENILTSCAGFMGAIGMNELISRYGVKQLKIKNAEKNTSKDSKQAAIQQKIDNKQVSSDKLFLRNDLKFKTLNDFIKKDENEQLFSNITDIPELRMFTSSMIALQSFHLAQEKGIKNKIKQMSYNLITGTAIPVFFISTAATLTKKAKLAIKAPILAVSALAGAKVGQITNNAWFSKTAKEIDNKPKVAAVSDVKKAADDKKAQAALENIRLPKT